MIGNDSLFNRFLLGSLIAHVVLFPFVFLIPHGTGMEQVAIYQVNIVEVVSAPLPPQPPDAPAMEPLDQPSLRALTPPENETSLPEAPLPPNTLPKTEPPEVTPPPTSDLGTLPPVPTDTTSTGVLPLPPVPDKISSDKASIQPPATDPAKEKQGEEQSLMDQLRKKVQKMQLRFEEPAAPPGKPGVASRPSAKSFLSLRKYQAQAQVEIQRNYKFPGSFPKHLKTRVRVVINRKGKVLSVEILDPSGNERFDYAAKLTLRSTRFPSIPSDIKGETLTQTIIFSP